MQALHADGTGLNSIELVDLPQLPPPDPKHVVLEVLLAVINPADLLTLKGEYGVKPDPPFIPGAECLARVISVGDLVRDLAPGDLVIPFGGGCWASHMTCHAGAVVKLPPGCDLAQAAMLKANPATALAMLNDMVALEPGDWVVQNAGNSAVGLNVIKIAHKLGLRTLSVVRNQSAVAALKEAGADEVIVDETCAPESIADVSAKLALDAVGGSATGALAGMLADGGTLVNYGLLSGEACQVAPYDLVFRDLKLRGFWLAKWFETADRGKIAAHYAGLVSWLNDGTIGAPVEHIYPIAEYAVAISHAAQPGRSGKILIEMPGFKELNDG